MSRVNLASRLIAGAIASASVFIGDANAGITSGPIVNPAYGHSYYLLRQGNWTVSERKARSLGGHLATVDNAAENAWIYSTFATFGSVNRSLWIGLNDAAVNDDFVWASGATSDTLFNESTFATGQPDNYEGEQYVHLIGPNWVGSTQMGKWNDAPDIISFNFNTAGSGRAFGALYGVVELDGPPVDPGSPLTTANATWANNADGFWHTTTNWTGGAVPNGVGAMAQLKRSFTGSRRTAYMAGSYTLGTLIFDDTDANDTTPWSICGTQTLTLASAVGTVPELRVDTPAIIGTNNTSALEIEVNGTQGFRKTGNGIHVLWEENPGLSGPISIEAGLLTTVHGSALGTDSNEVRISNNAGIRMIPVVNTTYKDKFIITGKGIPGDISGALRLDSLGGHESVTITIEEVVLAATQTQPNAKIAVMDDSDGRMIVKKLSGAANLVKAGDGVLQLDAPLNADAPARFDLSRSRPYQHIGTARFRSPPRDRSERTPPRSKSTRSTSTIAA